jgi:hypothetical protein
MTATYSLLNSYNVSWLRDLNQAFSMLTTGLS